VTTLGWDFAKGNLTAVTTPTAAGGTVTTDMAYDATFSQVTSITEPAPAPGQARPLTTFTRNAVGDVTAVTNARNFTTSVGRNGFGDVTAITNALNQTSSFTYGSFGELLTATDPQNHQSVLTYDGATRLTSARDANLKTVQMAYDVLDRVTSVTRTLNGQPVTTTSQYDENSNLRFLTDAENRTWEWVHDSMDRVSQAKNPLNQVASATFDLNSNPVTQTDRLGQKTEYSYGTGDRLTGVTFRRADNSVESTVTLAYNGTTHLLESITDSAFGSSGGTYSWTYDSLDRSTGRTGPQGSTTFTLDDLGRRTGLQVTGQGAISYGYDLTHNLTAITQNGLTATLEYDELGRLKKRTLPNGVSTEYGFNTAGFLTSLISKKSGVAFDSHSYSHDAIGLITSETANGVLSSFGYDDLYRLVSASVGSTSYAWSYDKVGNRLSQTVAGVGTSYTHNAANRLLTVNGAAVTHDANGNLTGFNGESYTWDVRGRLASLTKPGLTASYRYDPFGLRSSQTVNSTTTNFLLDGEEVVSEITGGTAKQTLHGPMVDQPLARDGKYFVPNHLGSTVALTDSGGNTVQQYSYSPFGAGTESPSPGDSNPFRFAGREDDETGLHYNRARYYRPEWGRFISEDPTGFSDESQYSYAGNNPVNFTDPLGLVQRDPFLREDRFPWQPGLESGLTTVGAIIGGLGGGGLGGGIGFTGGLVTGPGAIITGGAGAVEGAVLGTAAGAATGRLVARGIGGLIAYLTNIGGPIDPGSGGSGSGSPKIHWGKQGKHIPGHNDYRPGRSTLTHPDPQGLVDQFAGKGQQVGKIPRGQPGFKERVDFGVTIGEYISASAPPMPTTKGIIHYAADGTVHIVPAAP
jgi:RHS repeat-associated protein